MTTKIDMIKLANERICAELPKLDNEIHFTQSDEVDGIWQMIVFFNFKTRKTYSMMLVREQYINPEFVNFKMHQYMYGQRLHLNDPNPTEIIIEQKCRDIVKRLNTFAKV